MTTAIAESKPWYGTPPAGCQDEFVCGILGTPEDLCDYCRDRYFLDRINARNFVLRERLAPVLRILVRLVEQYPDEVADAIFPVLAKRAKHGK